MPIVYGTYTKQLKLLPLTLNADDTAAITVRYGYVNDTGDFEVSYEKMIRIDQTGVRSILDAEPTPGLSRRDDLSYAVYVYLVSNGFLEAGTIK